MFFILYDDIFFTLALKNCLLCKRCSFNCHHVRANTLVFNPAHKYVLKLSFLCSIFSPMGKFPSFGIVKSWSNKFVWSSTHKKNCEREGKFPIFLCLPDKLMSLVRFCHVCLLLCFVLACHMNSLLRTSDFRQIHHLPFFDFGSANDTYPINTFWIVS
jgi:hypothetical protein